MLYVGTVIGKQFIKFGVNILKLNHYYKYEENEKGSAHMSKYIKQMVINPLRKLERIIIF